MSQRITNSEEASESTTGTTDSLLSPEDVQSTELPQRPRKRKRVIPTESDSEEESKGAKKKEKISNNEKESERMEEGSSRVNEKESLPPSLVEEVVLQENRISLSSSPVNGDSCSKNGNDGSSETESKPSIVSFFGEISGAKNSTEQLASFDPSKPNYHPVDDACWKHGEKVPYGALCKTLAQIEKFKLRSKIIEILSNYFRSVVVLSPNDLLPSVYLCLIRWYPGSISILQGMDETLLMNVIAQGTGREVAHIKVDLEELGDLGLVAERSRRSQTILFPPPPLTVSGVFTQLNEIGLMNDSQVKTMDKLQCIGYGSQAQRMDKIQSIFVACKGLEARHLIRCLARKLRIGVGVQTILQAIAQAVIMTPPGQTFPPEIVDATNGYSTVFDKDKFKDAIYLKSVYHDIKNFDVIIPVLLKHGLHDLPMRLMVTPGVPLKPMEASLTKGVEEVFERFENVKFTCEWKYKGVRAQIHLSEEGKKEIFFGSRVNVTSRYPDIISTIKNTIGSNVKSFIIDTEVVAWDMEASMIRSCQIKAIRKRYTVSEEDIKVPVCVFMFDLLYLNGEPLDILHFCERRRLLRENFKPVEGQWNFATSLDTNSMGEVEEFFNASVNNNCDGLVFKTLDSAYEIGEMSNNWLMIKKKSYQDDIEDYLLDVVVIGGYLAKGNRTGVYGGFLLACYDMASDGFQSICKITSGFSDEDWQKHSDFFKNHVLEEPKPSYKYSNSLQEPDHWFEAVQVWEIKCAGLFVSSVHMAAIGIVHPEKGISLNSPRFVRIRNDKSSEEVTSAQQIAQIYPKKIVNLFDEFNDYIKERWGEYF